eukprot:scaffold36956_cov62-Phaeocystis_antarctica.AAC.7
MGPYVAVAESASALYSWAAVFREAVSGGGEGGSGGSGGGGGAAVKPPPHRQHMTLTVKS